MESQITKNAITKTILSIDSKTNYAFAIMKKTGMVYGTVHKILKDLDKDRFIEFNERKKIKILTLTEKGIKLKELLQEIKQL